MPNYSIRDVPQEVHAALKQEAARTRRSLNGLVVKLLTDHVEEVDHRRRLGQAGKLMDALRKKILKRRGLLSDSADLLREDRLR